METLMEHFKEYFKKIDMPVEFEQLANDEYDIYGLFNLLIDVRNCGNLYLTWEVHENYVNITVDHFMEIPSEDAIGEFLEFCNEINEKSRYATFFVDGHVVKLKHTVFLLDYDNMENTAQHVIDYVTNNLVILAEKTIGEFRDLAENY
ncbi:hypothetical protein AB5I83_08455 [Mesobacillus sp. LC4]